MERLLNTLKWDTKYFLLNIGNKYLVLPFCIEAFACLEISRERKVQVLESFESFYCAKTGRELRVKRKPS